MSLRLASAGLDDNPLGVFVSSDPSSHSPGRPKNAQHATLHQCKGNLHKKRKGVRVRLQAEARSACFGRVEVHTEPKWLAESSELSLLSPSIQQWPCLQKKSCSKRCVRCLRLGPRQQLRWNWVVRGGYPFVSWDLLPVESAGVLFPKAP